MSMILSVALSINKSDFSCHAQLLLLLSAHNSIYETLLWLLLPMSIYFTIWLEMETYFSLKPKLFGVFLLSSFFHLLQIFSPGVMSEIVLIQNQLRSTPLKSHHICKVFMKHYCHAYEFIFAKPFKCLLKSLGISQILEKNALSLVLQIMCGP